MHACKGMSFFRRPYLTGRATIGRLELPPGEGRLVDPPYEKEAAGSKQGLQVQRPFRVTVTISRIGIGIVDDDVRTSRRSVWVVPLAPGLSHFGWAVSIYSYTSLQRRARGGDLRWR